jgi:hypothetical protein
MQGGGNQNSTSAESVRSGVGRETGWLFTSVVGLCNPQT